MSEKNTYNNARKKGRPQHKKYSTFWLKHPPMDHVHRAKIFQPFDALKGFDEAIAAKEIQYVPKKHLDEAEKNEMLLCLQNTDVPVKVTYFVPCSDKNSDVYGEGYGIYQTVTGSVRKIDCLEQIIIVEEKTIPFEDISGVEIQNESAL